MAIQTKGGVPVTRRMTIVTSGAADIIKRVAPARTIHLRIVNTGANELRIYWTEDDYTAANSNYTSIAASGIWSEPAEIASFWPLAIVGSTVAEVTYFARRA